MQIDTLQSELTQNLSEKQEIETAYGLVKEASHFSISQLQDKIESLVNRTLEVLFPEEEFRLKLTFKEIRNLPACEVGLANGHSLNNIGGGALDVISLIIQLGLVKLQGETQLLIADEPLKHLSADKQAIIGKLISELCEDLDLQIIMVTHSQEFVESLADATDTSIVKI